MLASFHINPSDIWIVGVYLLSFLADRSVGEVLNVILGSNEDSSFGLDFLGPDGPERRYSIKEEAHLHFVCVFKHFQAYSCAQGKTDKDYFVASCSHIIDQGEEYLSYFLVVQRAQVSGIVVLTL